MKSIKPPQKASTRPATAAHDAGILLQLLIQPRASKTEIVGLHGTPPRLKIRVAAPPVDGAANEELIRFLSKKLKKAKSFFIIHRGMTGKTKDVICLGMSIDDLSLLFPAEE